MSQVKPEQIASIMSILQGLRLPYQIANIATVDNIYWAKPRSGQASFSWYRKSICIEPIETGLSGAAASKYRAEMLRTRVPAIAHELRHLQQWRDWGPLWFFLNNLPIVQSWKMEKEAYAVEDAAREQLGLADGLHL